MDDGNIMGRTADGRATARLLTMNAPRRVQLRGTTGITTWKRLSALQCKQLLKVDSQKAQ